MIRTYNAQVAKYVVLSLMEDRINFKVQWKLPGPIADNQATIEIMTLDHPHPDDCPTCERYFKRGENMAWHIINQNFGASDNSFPEDYPTGDYP